MDTYLKMNGTSHLLIFRGIQREVVVLFPNGGSTILAKQIGEEQTNIQQRAKANNYNREKLR
jgi:hypothetical protein